MFQIGRKLKFLKYQDNLIKEYGSCDFRIRMGQSIGCFPCYGRGRETRTLGTRFWSGCHIKRTVQIVPTVEPFVALGLLNLMPFDALLMLCENLIKFDAQLPKNRHTKFYLSITYIP